MNNYFEYRGNDDKISNSTNIDGEQVIRFQWIRTEDKDPKWELAVNISFLELGYIFNMKGPHDKPLTSVENGTQVLILLDNARSNPSKIVWKV